MVLGVNGWQHTVTLQMVSVDQAHQLQVKQASALKAEVLLEWQQQYKQQHQAELRKQEQLLETSTAVKQAPQQLNSTATGTSRTTNMMSSAGSIQPELQHVLDRPLASSSLEGGDWWMCRLPPLDTDVYEVNAVFSDGSGRVWDNCDGADFYLPVRQPDEWQEVKPSSSVSSYSGAPGRSGGIVAAAAALTATAGSAVAAALAAAAAAANGPADEAAAAAHGQLFFCLPPCPVAGAPATLYCNRARLSSGLHEAPNVQLALSFNGWEVPVQKVNSASGV